jgi:chemotaxis protein histidine kinase CheA
MPDVEAPAESSPAAPAPSSTESKPAAEPLSVPRDPKDYAEWRKTGNLPSAESAPAKESSDGEKPEKPAPAPEAGKPPQEKKRSNAESRLEELLSDLRTAGLTPSELKTFKREVRQEQAKAAPEPPVKPPASQVKKLEDYDSVEAYLEDLADHKATQKLEAYRAEEQKKAEQKVIADKLADAKKRYGDDAEDQIRSTARDVFNDDAIPLAVKALANDSPVLVDLLYVMGSNADELAEFVSLAKTNPGAAIRKLVLVEKLVQEELAKGGTPKASGNGDAPQRDETGKFLPAKKTTSAPPPPRETSGRSSPPPDESETALKEGNFALYREVENRREIARRKGL